MNKPISIIDKMKLRQQTFAYNYAWSDYITLFDGWFARCSMAVPIIGYLILFNDSAVAFLSFKEITSEASNQFYFDSLSRLRFLYFGLIFLGAANIFYRWRRPWVHKFGKNVFEFTDTGLRVFTATDYINFHHTIREEGHTTRHGKYYDSEWDGFREKAVGVEGRSKAENKPGHWNDAKAQYEYLLRNILHETFFRNSIKKRFSLTICLAVSLTGYVFLLIPSFDLFQAVLRNTFFS